MIQNLLRDPRYAENAEAMQREFTGIDGVTLASEIIEQAIVTSEPVPRAL